MLEGESEPTFHAVFEPNDAEQCSAAMRAVERFIRINRELCQLIEAIHFGERRWTLTEAMDSGQFKERASSAASRELLGRARLCGPSSWVAMGTVVTKLNQMMNGWANYFCLGPVSKFYAAIEQHARRRLRRWLCAKHKLAKASTGKYPDERLNDRFGLVRLTKRTRGFSWAKS
jgi:hypothetical protein